MSADHFNLAIETSTRSGSLALGRGDELVACCALGDQQRHAVQLMPQVEALARAHDFSAGDLREIYLSIGPGSFTGLRIAVSMAKMLWRVNGCGIVAVPTLEVIAAGVPVAGERLLIGLNAKGGRCFTGFFEAFDGKWRAMGEAGLLTCEQAAGRIEGAFSLVGDAAVLEMDWPERAVRLDVALSQPEARHVWQLGRAGAKAGRWVDGYHLVPLYVRLPEAEEKWRKSQEATSDES